MLCPKSPGALMESPKFPAYRGRGWVRRSRSPTCIAALRAVRTSPLTQPLPPEYRRERPKGPPGLLGTTFSAQMTVVSRDMKMTAVQ